MPIGRVMSNRALPHQFFLSKFRNHGLIDYNRDVHEHRSFFNVVLHSWFLVFQLILARRQSHFACRFILPT